MANNVEDMEPVLPEVSTPWFQKQLAAKARRKALSEGLGKSDVMGFGQEAATLGGQALEAGQTREMIKRGFGGKGSVQGDINLLAGTLTNQGGGVGGAPENTGIDDPTGGADVDGQTDSFTEISDLSLSQKTEAERLAALRLQEETDRLQTQLEKDIAMSNQLIEDRFTQRKQMLADQTERAVSSLGFSTAAAGSVRGSRREQRQIELENQAAVMQQSLQAEINLEKKIAEAALKGATAEELEPLKNNLARAKEATDAAQAQFDLAEQGLLQGQIEAASAAEIAAFEQANAALEAQGLVVDPISGEIVTTQEGEKIKANILKSNAQTAEIWDKISQPNIETKYFTDELGNVTASVFDKDAGEFETLNLGKLGKAEKWALGIGLSGTGGSGGGAGAGGVSEFGFDPTLATVYNDILEGGDPVEVANKYGYKGDARDLRAQSGNYEVAINAGYTINPLSGEISAPDVSAPTQGQAGSELGAFGGQLADVLGTVGGNFWEALTSPIASFTSGNPNVKGINQF